MLDFDYNGWYKDHAHELEVENAPMATYIYTKNGVEREAAINDTRVHVDLVNKFLEIVSRALLYRGLSHDWTKFDFPELTFEEHMKIERHHLNIPSGVHDDVDLLDVLEFTCDCVSAGLQRSGKINLDFLKVPEEVLQRAVFNTACKLVMLCKFDDERMEGE